jgi:DNA polymerase
VTGAAGTRGAGRAVGAEAFLPADRRLGPLREAAAGCRGCDLWQVGTRTVFGDGAADAEVVLVGEQPGDQEDRQGHPFVGPAGRVLDRALEEAGIDPGRTYTTNAVKHFKWERSSSGKRRIHKTPSRMEVVACRPWLAAELEAIGPQLVVALGATAAKALFGPAFRVTRERGQALELDGGLTALATVHPSSVLRAPDERARAAQMEGLVDDLGVAADLLRRAAPQSGMQ